AAEIASNYPVLSTPSALQIRIDWVAEVLKLETSEAWALGAVCRLTQYKPFMALAAAIMDNSFESDEVKAPMVGAVLGYRNVEVQKIFARKGHLAQLGLVEDRRGGDFAPSELLLSLLREQTTNPDTLMAILVGK